MYGDTAVLYAKARELRTIAVDARDRAKTLRAGAGSAWVSSAAATFTAALGEHADHIVASADALDDAADALEAHARAVDAVKTAIADAERWVSDRWHDAMHIASNAVEAIEDGVAGFFHVMGAVIPKYAVESAKDTVRTVPSLPTTGSREWLGLADTFRSQGW